MCAEGPNKITDNHDFPWNYSKICNNPVRPGLVSPAA
jgi:hypothetical protein